jgi:signal peptide peptidase SppA
MPNHRYSNIIGLLETCWMLPLHVLSRGIHIFTGRLNSTALYAQEKAFWDSDLRALYVDTSDALRPGVAVQGGSERDRFLRSMGVKITDAGTAVVPLVGVMAKRFSNFGLSQTGVSSDALADTADMLREDDRVRRVVLDIDSPGGSALGVELAAQAVERLNEEKPVTAVANAVMASGAYYVGSQASQIVTTPTSVVGSVGVYTTRIDWTEAEEQAGVKVHVISAGEFKVDGHPSTAFSDAEGARLQAEVNQYYNLFVSAVERGRGISGEEALALADGSIEVGEQAVERGFADRLGSLGEIVSDLDRKNKTTISTGAEMGLLDRFSTTSTGTSEGTITITSAGVIPTEDEELEQGTLDDLKASIAADQEELAAERLALAADQEAVKLELARIERETALSFIEERVREGRVLAYNKEALTDIMLVLDDEIFMVEDAEAEELITMRESFRRILVSSPVQVHFEEIAKASGTISSDNEKAQIALLKAYQEEHGVTSSIALERLQAEGKIERRQ